MATQPVNHLENPWRAPLVPVALAATVGMVLDRLLAVPLPFSLLLAAVSLAGWLVSSGEISNLKFEIRNSKLAALLCLWGGVLALGGAYHHWQRRAVGPDDISRLTGDRPKLVLLRCVLLEQPIYRPPGKADPLRSFPAQGRSVVNVRALAIMQQDQWLPVSGIVRLSAPQPLDHLRPGDEIEISGQLLALEGPGNPGEFDYAGYLQDQHVGALLLVKHSGQAIHPISRAPIFAPALALQETRGWAEQILADWLPERRDLARALLLGEQEALDQESWDRYQHTGVVHVLAVSGQHLVVLAGFLALALRVCQVPRRRIALTVPLVLLGYSLLTGWRPPVQRSFFMVGAYYGAFWLRRVVLPANSFALAWLLVCLADPSSVFSSGCQLSFLASGVLLWGTGFLKPRPKDPVQELLDEQRPLWQKIPRDALANVLVVFVAGVVVWLAVAPLVAWHFHLVSPIALVIGVPVLLLTSLALLTGFLLLLLASLLGPVAAPFAWVTDISLAGCDWLLTSVERWPLSFWYVPDLPVWWVGCFYLLLCAGLVLPELRRRPVPVGAALLSWLCLGLALPLLRFGDGQFRCTFLAVGHGTCVVLELPDGRTMLYDAGSLSGPDVARRQIAPFLWNRGIRRIDEVFLSHADLDHFNGLTALTERFAIGHLSCTPSFSEREVAGVQFTLKSVQGKSIPIRVLKAGDRLNAGAVDLQVLHPPAVGPPGKENHRSLVLLVRHLDHALLLTGDLEGPGQDMVLALPPVPVEILMAPHHGSPAANNPTLAKWAAARVVISCQGLPRSPIPRPDPYTPHGAIYLTTWHDGAVSISSGDKGLWVDTFKGKQKWKVR